MPLHFIAQIDLSAVKPPSGSTRPAGLPSDGALLVFIGQSYAIRFISQSDMAASISLPLPTDLPPISAHGYFGEGACFTKWPIDLVAYIDTTGERPSCLPDPFAKAENWITTWGLAALEAEHTIEVLERELGFSAQSKAHKARIKGTEYDVPPKPHMIKSDAYYATLDAKAPHVINTLKAFHQQAKSRPATGDVNMAQLTKVFQVRMDLCDQIGSYMPKYVLPGRPKDVWDKILYAHKSIYKDGDYNVLPAAYRPFIEMMIADWRGHRLLGAERAPPYNYEDLRGQDCVIRIAADRLLGTTSEHEHAVSIWCPRKNIAKGIYKSGQLLRHGNG